MGFVNLTDNTSLRSGDVKDTCGSLRTPRLSAAWADGSWKFPLS